MSIPGFDARRYTAVLRAVKEKAMTARQLPEARKKDLVEIKIPYEGHSTGASMAQDALNQAKGWPEKLDLDNPGVKKVKGKAGDYVVFTFRKAGG